MRVLLLGLDGATFSVLDPLVQQGEMPFLGRLLASGARAELISTTPPLTFPAWTSLATGRSPGAHGIVDFVYPEETDRGMFVRPLNATNVRCEPLWSMVSRQDRTVTCLNFPVTAPKRPIDGYLVPGWVPARYMRESVHPESLYEELKALPDFDAPAIAWNMELEEQAVQAMPADEYEGWIRFHILRERKWFEILKYLLQRHPCDLTALVADGTDKLCHLAWRLIAPESDSARSSPWERKIRALCLEFFRQLDELLAEVVELVGSDTRVLVVSDHGSGPTDYLFYVNAWLHQQGYLQWGSAGIDPDESETMFRRRKSQLLDLDRTVAYAPTPSSNGIRIRVAREPGQVGIPPREYESFRNALTASLLALRHPESGQPVVLRVFRREEVFAGEAMSLAPDLTLALADGGFVSTLNSPVPVKPRQEIKGTHRYEGVFLAAGPGIRRGVDVGQFSILDVCPVVLHGLGLDIPADLEGRLPSELFEPGYLEQHPPRTGAPTVLPGVSERPMSASEEAEVLRRLRALGYVE